MIYLKKVEVDRLVVRLMIQIHRKPKTYTKAFLEQIDGTDHPIMQALTVHGFIEPVSNNGEQITMALSDEGWEFWHQIIAIIRDDRSKKR